MHFLSVAMKQENQKLIARWFVISVTAALSMGNILKAEANPDQEEDSAKSQPASKMSAISSMVNGHAKSIFDELNSAMSNAAVNPMDEWRRERLRKAYAAVPTAVNGVASSFFSDKIGRGSLPLVQQMMGAMIDQEAPNSYDKFLKDPNHQLAPNASTSASQESANGQGYALASKTEKTLEVQTSFPVKQIVKVALIKSEHSILLN